MKSFHCKLEFKKQDAWVGLYWNSSNIWICLIPFFPIHIIRKSLEPRIILNHQGYDYYVKSGQCIFPKQPHKVKPTIIMDSLILEENDSIRFSYSVDWIWKNNTFVIASGGAPWLFHWLDDEGIDCGIQ